MYISQKLMYKGKLEKTGGAGVCARDTCVYKSNRW